MSADRAPICCYVGEDGTPCGAPAEHSIWDGREPWHAHYVEACEAHTWPLIVDDLDSQEHHIHPVGYYTSKLPAGAR